MTGVVGATPLLVYNRIDANRRKTCLLLIAFAVVILPALSGVGACLIVPSLDMRYGAAHPVEMASLQDQMRALQPAADGTYHLLDLPPALPWLYARFNLEATAIVTLLFVAITACLVYKYGSRIVLRSAQARLVQPDHEQDLVQTVENLCIAAGLPIPRLYVIESAAPNAFATGRTPTDASLVVTRGLLELLDRRELESVIAHELSHIGNHDVGLTTTLAALVGTVNLPLTLLSAPFRFALRTHWAAGVVVTFMGLQFILPLLVGLGFLFAFVTSGEFSQGYPSYIRWWLVCVWVAPFYAVFVAPVVALLIRQAVSRQREFLADADAALLTRNPEGLALALVKISAVRGERLRVGEGAVHLYFVDPRAKGSWLHVVFPSHPPVEKRIELLARMANGITPSAMQAARDAGASFQQTKSVLDEVHAPLPGPPCDETAFSTQATEPTGTSDDGFTRVYDRPDDGSRVVALLPENAAVKVERREGDFVRVATESGVAGWVFRAAPLDIQGVAAADHALTPLYEKPDGWSRVLAQLPEGAVIIPTATEGNFVRVTTADNQAGYVSRSAPLAALKNYQP